MLRDFDETDFAEIFCDVLMRRVLGRQFALADGEAGINCCASPGLLLATVGVRNCFPQMYTGAPMIA
jgi:hypothetical protein